MARISQIAKMSTRYQPPLYITEKQLPAIKDWKVGGKYQITLNVEQVGLQSPSAQEAIGYDEDSGDEKNEGLEARFKILSVATPDTEEASESDISKVLKSKATS